MPAFCKLTYKVDWLSLPVDVKGTIYEELLSR
jgi:hypothetical protein